MPEYLAPGVFVEEVSYRAKSIEGVSTTTTGFIGPTRFGPVDVEPGLITGLGEFERIYGDRQQLSFADSAQAPDTQSKLHNFVWHAVRAFFENEGKRLYVKRVFQPLSDDDPSSGCASSDVVDGKQTLTIRSRFPGASGGRRVRVTLELGANILAPRPQAASGGALPQPNYLLRGLKENDVVWVSQVPAPQSPPASPPANAPERTGTLFLVGRQESANGTTWTFTGTAGPLQGGFHVDAGSPAASDEVRVVTATVSVFPSLAEDPEGLPLVWSGLALDPSHVSFGSFDALTHQFGAEPANLQWRRTVPLVIEWASSQSPPKLVPTGLDIANILVSQLPAGAAPVALASPPTPAEIFAGKLAWLTQAPAQRSWDVILTDGNDGLRPSPAAYEGRDTDPDDKTGLKSFEDLEEISIVAAPGATYGLSDPGYRPQAMTIIGSLISHAERMRYRIAVLDSGNDQDLSDVQALRSAFDSKHAAIYYPWVRVFDPVTSQEISLPPSGFVAGIYARNDIQRAVYKAPANEVVTLSLGFERTINKAQQEVLNPKGINCLRYFEGRGNRVWGARTISSDPEWIYVNMRRYFAYLERSIDVGTQWAVFEPNGPALWANVRRTVSDFLFNEFMLGAFVGDKPETSYFVRCDRSTMTQNDLDYGRLVCQVGVAVVKPAEFVIFRIGQWTGSAKG